MIRPVEAQLAAQQVGDDSARERRGDLLRFETGIPAVADHHAVDPRGELPEDRELVRLQLCPGSPDDRQVVVRIDAGGGVAGKMFAATRDPLARAARR